MTTNALIRISPVDASTYQQANDLRRDLKGLQSALTKGDLASAQSALSQLQQDIRSSNTQSNGVRVSPDNNPQATLSRDIQALQLALNAGDLAAVKAAFDRMQQDTQQIAKTQQQTQQKSAAQSATDDSTNSVLADPKSMAAKARGNLIDVYA
jgi:DNA repair exonuclease SbcCD ATPase subunit